MISKKGSGDVPNVHLHLGFHKTATTYIQQLLRLNAERLSGRVHLEIRTMADESTTPLRKACQRYFKHETADAAEAITAEMRKIADKAYAKSRKDMIMSDEALIGPQLGQFGERAVYSKLEPILERILAGTGPYSPHLVIYTRNREQWLKSVHNQAVKQCRFKKSYQRFLKECDTMQDWQEVIERIRQSFPDVPLHHIRMEDDLQTRFGAGHGLLKAAGLEDLLDDLELPRRTNESLSPLGLEIMRGINRLRLSNKELGKIRRVIVKSDSKCAGKARPDSA